MADKLTTTQLRELSDRDLACHFYFTGDSLDGIDPVIFEIVRRWLYEQGIDLDNNKNKSPL